MTTQWKPEDKNTVNKFAARHLPGSGLSYLDLPIDRWQVEHSRRVARAFEAGRATFEPAKDGQGTVAFVELLENDVVGYLSGKVKPETSTEFETEFEPRQKGEDPVIDYRAIDGQPMPAKKVVSIEYHTSALGPDERSLPENQVGWETVSINAAANTEDLQSAISMARNQLGLEGGTQRDYTGKAFAESVIHERTHAMLCPVRSTDFVVDKAIVRTAKYLVREIPELGLLMDCPEPKKPQADNSLIHTAQVVVSARMLGLANGLDPAAQLELEWAAKLHDVGKPQAKEIDGDDVTYKGHNKISVEIATHVLDRFPISEESFGLITMLIHEHERMLALVRDKSSPPMNFNALQRIRETMGSDRNFRLLALLSQADDLVTGYHYQAMFDYCIAEGARREQEKSIKKQVSEILTSMGVAPGPVFGKVQQAIIDNPPLATEDLESKVREIHSTL